MGVNKVVYGGETLIDLTNNTVTPETLASGVTATNAAGETIVGLMPLILGSAEYPGCYYHVIDNVVEWLSPPTIVGVEYRTTERWNGKTVYTKLINCGFLPNASVSVIEHEALATQIIRCTSQDITRGKTISPKLDGIDIYADTTGVYITTSVDCSFIEACTQIWYTKD